MPESKTRPEDLKLITRDEVTEILGATENLTFTDLKPGDDIDVKFHGTTGEPLVELGGTELQVLPQALIDSGRCVGMLAGYIQKCPIDLLFSHLNYFFGEGMEVPLRAVTREDRLLSITKDRVKTPAVSNERLLRLAEQKIGSEHILGYHQVYSDLEHSTISIVLDKVFEPVHEDTLFGGIKLRNSILGKDVIEIDPYIFRQWCSNGATTEESLGRYNRKKHDILDNWVSEIIDSADRTLNAEFERIRHLTEISVNDHVSETVRGLGKDYRISNKIIEEVLEEVYTDPKAETMYDVYNAFTWVASHNPGLTPNAIHKLQQIGGRIAKKNALCGSCHRVLN
jgi:hypothetical protein